MGEARRRGTYEERKAQAIREGRVKRRKQPRARHHSATMTDIGMALLGMARYRRRK